MKNKANLIFTALFFCFLLALPIGTLLSRKGDYSIFENRSLAEAPSSGTSLDAVLDGQFFQDLETWYKDHVVLRDNILKACTLYQMVLGKPAVNDIITRDGSLLPVVEPKYAARASDEEIAAEVSQLAALNETARAYDGEFIYFGVPGQITMFADSYPDCLSDTPGYFRETAKKFQEELTEAGITFVDGWDYLTQDMYYRVDHHFGVTGGYKVYEQICARTGVEAVPMESFDFYRLPNPFYGSRNRKIYDMTPVSDSLEVFSTDIDIPFDRYDNGRQVPSVTIPLPEDDSAVVTENYMGGDIAETVIETHRPDLPNLLIYGDSYTNSVECFAYMSFNETRSLDLRHYDEMTLCEYVERYKPDYIVCIRDDGNYTTLSGNGRLTG